MQCAAIASEIRGLCPLSLHKTPDQELPHLEDSRLKLCHPRPTHLGRPAVVRVLHGLGRIEVHVLCRPGVEVGVDPRVVQILALEQRIARDMASLCVDPAQETNDDLLPDSSRLPVLLRQFGISLRGQTSKMY